MLRCTLELTVRYGLVRRGSSDSKHALQVATGCVAARGGYHRAERPSIRGTTADAAGAGLPLHNAEVWL